MGLSVDKTVFISYRRTNSFLALSIYQHLTQHGYDVFFDFMNIPSGSFEEEILNNIEARSHFIAILTPSALERCSNPGDWLRREIEYAIETKRNIIPLFFEGFDFSRDNIKKHLTGKLAILPRYNGMSVQIEWFDAAMERLRSERFLNRPIESVNHPKHELTSDAEKLAQEQQEKANEEEPVTAESLSAEEWFESGILSDKLDEKVSFFTKAIELQPDMADAYYERGEVYLKKKQHDEALADATKALGLEPEFVDVFILLGRIMKAQDKPDEALQYFNDAIHLDPEYARAYINRGIYYYEQGIYELAMADYTEAIRLDPESAPAYGSRGNCYYEQGDYELAMADYTEAIRLDPESAPAYGSRGNWVVAQC